MLLAAGTATAFRFGGRRNAAPSRVRVGEGEAGQVMTLHGWSRHSIVPRATVRAARANMLKASESKAKVWKV